MKKKISNILILLGLLLIVGSLGLVIYNLTDNKRAAEASEAIVSEVKKSLATEDHSDYYYYEQNPSVPLLEEAIPLYKLYPEMEMPVVDVDGYYYIGTLQFPDLDLTLPVMQEWDYDRLKISTCRFTGSIYTKDMVIAGHNYKSHLGAINSLPVGSTVIFTDTVGNIFNYNIGWTEVIMPNDVEGMTGESEDDPWDLTIFTCTYGGSSRYTVRCCLVE